MKYTEVLLVWNVKFLSNREDVNNTLELGQTFLEFEGKNHSWYFRNVTAQCIIPVIVYSRGVTNRGATQVSVRSF